MKDDKPVDIMVRRVAGSSFPSYETVHKVWEIVVNGLSLFVGHEGKIIIHEDVVLELINEPFHGYQGLVIKAVSDDEEA